MANYHRKDGVSVSEEQVVELLSKYPQKFLWFAQKGYKPHFWQFLFHSNTDEETERICRFRHLVAGRRGGKTMAAAWECVFYALHPEAFHKEYHGKESNRPLVIWIVTQDYPIGLWAKLAVREALAKSDAVEGVDYKENRGHQWIEFSNGSFLLYKTADEPNKLRGAGVDIMWFDEAAVIVSQEAWEVASPALANTVGMFISTTTPDGKNWFYNEFWNQSALQSSHHGRVEYWSIDSPFFPVDEWSRLAVEYHPMKFKQEFMASFDAMAGKELSGDWLHYYDEKEISKYKGGDGLYRDLNIYIAVDPAVSLADTADKFAIAAVGVTKDRRQAYLLEQWSGRIPFPEQVDKINQWYIRYSPYGIGIEKNAYQAALVQQVQRLEGLPPVVPIHAAGKKSDRILAMAPFFRTGRIKISPRHSAFIDEWINYDSEKKNPQDDCLDSVELALRTAGIILPSQRREQESLVLAGAATTADMWSEIAAKASQKRPQYEDFDEHLGDDW